MYSTKQQNQKNYFIWQSYISNIYISHAQDVYLEVILKCQKLQGFAANLVNLHDNVHTAWTGESTREEKRPKLHSQDFQGISKIGVDAIRRFVRAI